MATIGNVHWYNVVGITKYSTSLMERFFRLCGWGCGMFMLCYWVSKYMYVLWDGQNTFCRVEIKQLWVTLCLFINPVAWSCSTASLQSWKDLYGTWADILEFTEYLWLLHVYLWPLYICFHVSVVSFLGHRWELHELELYMMQWHDIVLAVSFRQYVTGFTVVMWLRSEVWLELPTSW